MEHEHEKYQNIKETILLIAWNLIEKNKNNYVTNETKIIQDVKELSDYYELSHVKTKRLLDEIVNIDRWLANPKGYDNKVNKLQFIITPKGREQIDEILMSKGHKILEWLKAKAPILAKYIDETVIKPAIKSVIEKSIGN